MNLDTLKTIGTGQQVTSLDSLLRLLVGCPCAVVGGAVRDTVFGTAPRDYDIVVLSEEDAFTVADVIYQQYGSDWQVVGDYGDGREQEPDNDFWERWSMFIKLNNVDILVSREDSFDAAACTFDNTINMWLAFPGESHKDSYIKFAGLQFAPLGIAQQVKPVRRERSVYIAEKATTLGWEWRES